MRTNPARVAASFLTAVATAIVILAVAVIVFLNPVWVFFEQDRSTSVASGGRDAWSADDRREATGAILGDLLLWRGDFEVHVRGEPVLTEAERGHMRDVRRVFAGFGVLTVASLAWLALARRRIGGATFWRAARIGAAGLFVGLVAAGAIATLAFDAAFAVFHVLLFSGGNWAFDPETSRLVQLFPMVFWFETTIAVGVVAGVLALAAVVIAARRARPATGPRVGVEAVASASG